MMKLNPLKALGFALCALPFVPISFAQDIKQPNVSGAFYPDNSNELSEMIDNFLDKVNPAFTDREIFGLICPHAGYGFSGETAGFGYKLIKGRIYKTVVIIGTSHYYGFNGVSVYPRGVFRTPLGDLNIDDAFAEKLFNQDENIIFDYKAFEKEHSIEVQLPFLQKVLSNNFKIVPIIMGDCSFALCRKLAEVLKEAIGTRRDILVITSTDLFHGYDYQQAEITDNLTLSYLKKMDSEGLYYSLRDNKAQLCGGFAVVSMFILADKLGGKKLKVLKYTNSALATGRLNKGVWTVGYVSCVVEQSEGEKMILTRVQKKKLLGIARKSIEAYLKNSKKIEIIEEDAALLEEMGAFVTLHKYGQLRGCIGNIIGCQPLYLTVRDMAVEAATADPRFSPLDISELKNIKIEISALSPLQKIDSIDKIELGKHGVLIKKGSRSGVFLPQVATETGWSKQEFLENLCVHKAGLSVDAWKDKTAEIYIFSAEVFSEEE